MDVNELKPASNSYKARSSIDAASNKVEEKRVKNTVPASMEQKPSLINRFLKSFMQTDLETIKTNIMDDYVIPGIKDAILGIIDMFFYKDGAGPKGRGSNGGYVSYGQSYRGNRPVGPRAREERRQHNFDYRELSWPTRGKAEAALNGLWEILDEYKMVRIADLFDLAEATPPGDSTGNDYGWRDLSGSEVLRTYDGRYAIKLPQAVSLK